MDKLISVIVPIYNVENYLDRCVESIVNQTYTNLEIILVDDGSPDSSPKKCDDWAKRDKRIKVIHKENEGVSKTRNRGIDIANGQFLSFIDSDDYIESNFFELLYKTAEQEDYDIVFGRYNKIFDNAIEKDNEFIEQFVLTCDKRLLFCEKCKVNAYLCRALFKKQIFDNLRYDEELKFLEDLHLFLKMLEKQPKLGYVDEFIYNYVIHHESLCNKINQDYSLKFELGALKCSEQLQKMGNDLESKSILFSCYLVALKQGLLLGDKKLIKEFSSKYNTQTNYRAFIKCNPSVKTKIKAILARYKITFVYKILLKLNK